MSRYTGLRLRIVRRLGELPGLTRKVPKKTTPPGQHGAARKKLSEYAIRLMERQKLRFNYGLSETQLVRYVAEARRIRGSTGQCLDCWRCAWITRSFAWGSLRPSRPPGRWSTTVTSASTAAR